MNLFEFERILNRYLKGKATEEEKRFIEHWLAIREADQKNQEEQENIHAGSLRRQLAYAGVIIVLITGIIWQYRNTWQKPGAIHPTIQKKPASDTDSTADGLFPDSGH
ncbi:hypothetical protein HHL16_21605 [Pseudoflavitalea sp. G-6-1-2]|uniref:hypothetical protein n=1 Tax=Pseudoflavitalea sp. G-6-1-2 TaxID=2728841 RepID=UPI001469DF66|nr:hypothetical protein [Pseudoflavitalea sp. G-6-1-2]NML23491.1 hypothetical protein [Pseudoflavitalea sp. G-6-1-2]